VRGKDGVYYGRLWLFRDITEHEHMDAELQRRAQLLERANQDLEQRNQELDEFTYVASHDLQEPLRKLVAFSHALQEDMAADDEEEVRQDLKVIASAALRMQQLVQDLLSLSRSGRREMSLDLVPLDNCVDEALEALELRIEETGATLQRDQLPTVRGDAGLLTQLFQNLIGNALKFHGEEPPHVSLSAEQAEAQWLVEVADNGIGLKPEYAQQIFSPFKRLHRRDEYEGTGIGLAICRKIVERHGGKIWVESEPGKGARFRFTLAGDKE
jgi:light-regulated signal transduction histidine kinase (bacteriophytochrome)